MQFNIRLITPQRLYWDAFIWYVNWSKLNIELNKLYYILVNRLLSQLSNNINSGIKYASTGCHIFMRQQLFSKLFFIDVTLQYATFFLQLRPVCTASIISLRRYLEIQYFYKTKNKKQHKKIINIISF